MIYLYYESVVLVVAIRISSLIKLCSQSNRVVPYPLWQAQLAAWGGGCSTTCFRGRTKGWLIQLENIISVKRYLLFGVQLKAGSLRGQECLEGISYHSPWGCVLLIITAYWSSVLWSSDYVEWINQEMRGWPDRLSMWPTIQISFFLVRKFVQIWALYLSIFPLYTVGEVLIPVGCQLLGIDCTSPSRDMATPDYNCPRQTPAYDGGTTYAVDDWSECKTNCLSYTNTSPYPLAIGCESKAWQGCSIGGFGACTCWWSCQLVS